MTLLQTNSGWIVVITEENTDAEIKTLDELMDRGFFVTSFKVGADQEARNITKRHTENLCLITVINEIASFVADSSSLYIAVKCNSQNTKELLRMMVRSSVLCSFHVHWIVFLSSASLVSSVSAEITRDVNLWLIAPKEGNLQQWNLLMLMYDGTRAHYMPLATPKWNAAATALEPRGSTSTLPRNDPSKNLRGKMLKVVLEQHFPFFIPPKDKAIAKGADIDLLEIMSKAFNFSYEIVRPPDRKWGSKINGTWNGMIGMVYREEVDAALGGMTITAARAGATTFSTPYAYDRTTFAARAPSEATRAWVILRPLQMQVWLAIAGMVIFIATLLGVAEKMLYRAKSTATKISTPEKEPKKLISFPDTFLYTYRSFLLQECYNPSDVSTRVVVVSWWIFVITLVTGYNGHLISFMTNPGVEDAIDTIQKLVAAIRQGKFTCGTIKDSSDHNIFKVGDSEVFATILKSMESDPANFVHHDVQGLARALKINYAYIAGHLTVDADIKRPELFRFAKDSFQFSGYGIALNKGSWYTEALDQAIHRLRQFGLVDKWIENHIESARDYSDRVSGEKERKLEVADIQGAFFLLCIGFVISISVFFIERIVKLCRHQKTDSRASRKKPHLLHHPKMYDVQPKIRKVPGKKPLILKT